MTNGPRPFPFVVHLCPDQPLVVKEQSIITFTFEMTTLVSPLYNFWLEVQDFQYSEGDLKRCQRNSTGSSRSRHPSSTNTRFTTYKRETNGPSAYPCRLRYRKRFPSCRSTCHVANSKTGGRNDPSKTQCPVCSL